MVETGNRERRNRLQIPFGEPIDNLRRDSGYRPTAVEIEALRCWCTQDAWRSTTAWTPVQHSQMATLYGRVEENRGSGTRGCKINGGMGTTPGNAGLTRW